MSLKIVVVYTTVASLDNARTLAKVLVERRLAACAEVSPIESFYRWNGAVQNEPEYRIVFKTSEARYGEVEAAIRELHPYELPAIHALTVDHVHEPYAAWVREGTASDQQNDT